MSRHAPPTSTATVQQTQHEQNSHPAHHPRISTSTGTDALTDTKTAFLITRDGFYLATLSDTRWPYIQYRGGPRLRPRP